MNRPPVVVRTLAVVVLAVLGPSCSASSTPGRGPAISGSGTGVPADPDADRVAWKWDAPPPASIGAPAADGDGVVFSYGHQHLVLLDAKGAPRWDVARLGLRDVAPLLTTELVVAATDEGMAAFRRSDGGKLWDTPLAARANTPVAAGRLAVTSTWEGELVGLDLAGGRVAWRTPLGGAAIGPPATDGTSVVATWEKEGGAGGGAVGVVAATGRRRWATPLPPGGISGPTVTADGLLVAVAGDLAAHALALDGGQERWRTPLAGAGSPEVPPVAVADGGAVLVAHRLGGLDLLDAPTGRRRWQVGSDGAAVRGGPVTGPVGVFAFPLDDGRLMMAGPERVTEFRQAPGRISGVVVGPRGLLVAATRGAAVNTVQATPYW